MRFPLSDVLVYRAEGAAVRNGTDLYGFTVTEWKLPATYPPFAALLFVPVALAPLSVVKAAFVVGNVALLALLVALSLRFAPRAVRLTHTLPLVLAVTAGAVWLEPVFQTLVFGQINLALACLVLWDLGRPDGARAKGFALGVAAGVKLTPAIFAVYLLLTGRVRAGLYAVAGFACTVGAGALVLPGASVEFWSRRMFETTRVGKAWIVDNQSLQGLIARLTHHPEPGPLWLVPAVVLAATGMWLARRLYVRQGRTRTGDYWGVMATAMVSVLVSPISWSHHWVWCVPLLVGLALTAPRWVTVTVVAVFTARTMWLVPKAGDLDLHLAWWYQPLASPYAFLTLTLLATAFALTRKRAPCGGGRDSGRGDEGAGRRV
ncbi:glycosyltransferase 87 family protein [Streptomyces iconiensis]|uniref:Glycosyltransferase 87 family protein n=2 Tax=Streptomyces iconiensis TaxID=1384038 RepID=A0ABT7A864_9ACTN|nr:glycosyltransferase 87 family protein [Streptomyces iconiensis]MDJ1137527.1 glycosyltransferase 87 family protein [Streptomyces iconiensis]